MTDSQNIINSFIENLFSDELKRMDEKSNDPYIMGWNECLNYIRTKSYTNMYCIARNEASTFTQTPTIKEN